MAVRFVQTGDWHTANPDPVDRPSERMYYAGAPEVGGWDEVHAGSALVVELEEGVPPRVRPIRVGRFRWDIARPGLFSGEDVAKFGDALAGMADRDQLVQVRPSGALTATAREGLRKRVEELEPEFAGLFPRWDDLRIAAEGDTSAIADPLIRAAVDRLNGLLGDPSAAPPALFPGDLPRPDADTTSLALARLRNLLP